MPSIFWENSEYIAGFCSIVVVVRGGSFCCTGKKDAKFSAGLVWVALEMS